MFENVFEFHRQSLKETLQLNRRQFGKVSRILETAGRIEFFFDRNVLPSRLHGLCEIEIDGLRASTECDSHLQLINATQLRKGDVAFGIPCQAARTRRFGVWKSREKKRRPHFVLTNCMKSPITAPSGSRALRHPNEINISRPPWPPNHPACPRGCSFRLHCVRPQEPHTGRNCKAQGSNC